MEIDSFNYLITTGSITFDSTKVDSSSFNLEWIMNPSELLKVEFKSTTGAANGYTFTIDFGQTLSVDRVAIVNHNLRGYRITYNSSTVIALDTSFHSASSAVFSQNSATSNYIKFSSAINTTHLDFSVTSVFDSNGTPANTFSVSSSIGYLYIGKNHIDFGDDRGPSANMYNPKKHQNKVDHKLGDGRVITQTDKTNWEFDIKLDHVTKATRDTLKTIYDDKLPLHFCPFEQKPDAGWDGLFVPVIWVGDFDFFKYSENSTQEGFDGSIKLIEKHFTL